MILFPSRRIHMKNVTKPYRALMLGIFFGILIMARHASAGEKLLIGGAEGGGGSAYNYYAYTGLIAPLLGSDLGNGFVQRYWVDVLGYRYEANSQVDANALGVEAALGYQKKFPSGWGALYFGGRYANTWLSPYDPGNRNGGGHVWAKVQAEAETDLTQSWKVNGIASYIFLASDYWVRGRLMHRLNNGLYTGPEAIIQGDPSYKAWQFGWVLTGFEPFPKSNLGVKAGVRITERVGPDGYVGVELTKAF
jgi:hypothetical protein